MPKEHSFISGTPLSESHRPFFIPGPGQAKSLKTAFRDHGTPPGSPSLPLSTG